MTEYLLRTSALPGPSRNLTKAAVDILAEAINDPELLHEFDLILTEACANVVRHAYGGSPGELEIRLQLDHGASVRLEVADSGRGFSIAAEDVADPGPTAEGGRGLFIMSQLTDEFQVRHDHGRTRVRMQKTVEGSQWKS